MLWDRSCSGRGGLWGCRQWCYQRKTWLWFLQLLETLAWPSVPCPVTICVDPAYRTLIKHLLGNADVWRVAFQVYSLRHRWQWRGHIGLRIWKGGGIISRHRLPPAHENYCLSYGEKGHSPECALKYHGKAIYKDFSWWSQSLCQFQLPCRAFGGAHKRKGTCSHHLFILQPIYGWKVLPRLFVEIRG